MKDKYCCVQFRTTDNESNCNSGKKPCQKILESTGIGSKWTCAWTEDPLIATETAWLYLNNSNIPRKELCKDKERKPTLKMWSLDYFSGAGFSSVGNHKQQPKGAGVQLRPNLICLVKILCSFHSITISNFQAPMQPLLANNPLYPLTSKGK